MKKQKSVKNTHLGYSKTLSKSSKIKHGTWICKAVPKSPLSNAWQSWTSLSAAFLDMSPLLSLANNAPIFLELSSISRLLPGFTREPPKASDVSLKSLVNVAMTGFWLAVLNYPDNASSLVLRNLGNLA